MTNRNLEAAKMTMAVTMGAVTQDIVIDFFVSKGALTTGQRIKLDGIQKEATKNSTDEELLDRANHEGTQEIETIEGLEDALAGKLSINAVLERMGEAEDATMSQAALTSLLMQIVDALNANGIELVLIEPELPEPEPEPETEPEPDIPLIEDNSGELGGGIC